MGGNEKVKEYRSYMKKKLYFLVFLLLLLIIDISFGKDNSGQKKDSLSKTVSNEKKVLKFGLIPARDETKLSEKYFILKFYLENEIGREIKLVFKKTYEEIANDLSDTIDFAGMGAYSYLLAEKLNEAQPIVRTIRYGKSYYYSTIIVRKDSNINSLKDLKNKKIGFSDRYSSAGFLYPASKLLEIGFNFKNDIKYKFITGYDNIVFNVYRKKFDAGAVYENAEKIILSEKAHKNLKIIYKSEKIPSDPIVAGKRLLEDKELIEKIKQVFLKLNPKEYLILLSTLGGGIEGYIESSKEDYNELRKKIETVKKVFK